ncbi:hypothetical protein GUJ93_ZPchr0014g47423 [Zizania palustris]|uniref:Uncharacterized protein n=1 Tax=Zizania palustris TaxID=103762 RepID=A0A8J5TBV6_ZIZPA|nr:hypothetical protein GUJ93_ZPchr0014g47423 [Zizania palustris]
MLPTEAACSAAAKVAAGKRREARLRDCVGCTVHARRGAGLFGTGGLGKRLTRAGWQEVVWTARLWKAAGGGARWAEGEQAGGESRTSQEGALPLDVGDRRFRSGQVMLVVLVLFWTATELLQGGHFSLVKA